MKRDVYQKGVKGKKYGIWNTVAKRFQFGISEDTPIPIRQLMKLYVQSSKKKTLLNAG